MKLKALILATLAVFSTQALWAEPATEKSVRELLIATGAGNMGLQMMNSMIAPLKKALPKATETFWEEFMKEVNADELVNMTVPIYQKHFSEEDIQALVTFYKSPVGQRVLGSLPVVMQEAMKAGQQWGWEIGERALERAKQQNLTPAK